MLNGRKNKSGIKQLKANAIYMEMEKKLTDNNFSETLYNEKRNAIPSWQGYEYQGKVAIRRYLEILSGYFRVRKKQRTDVSGMQRDQIEDRIARRFYYFQG